jgi:hypothetical protein
VSDASEVVTLDAYVIPKQAVGGRSFCVPGRCILADGVLEGHGTSPQREGRLRTLR